jgi:sulfate adenylyltransferase subunit 1
MSMDLLRFSIIGNVDEGKSTLIGRLLYDSKSLLDDQLEQLEINRQKRGEENINLALLTDGLRAEREQGITIDVAYRYFQTKKRKFIVADCPGHPQYTRNMLSGSSQAQVALILIDVRAGLSEQTKRHLYISSMLGMQEVVVCVNKMDLVSFEQSAFLKIQKDFESFLSRISLPKVSYIPLSALSGENVVEKSSVISWYNGDSLLQHLEKIELKAPCEEQFFATIQRVAVYKEERYYAAKIHHGEVAIDQEIKLLPSEEKARIKKIFIGEQNLHGASAPLSVTLTLDRDFDLSSGDAIAHASFQKNLENKTFLLCWLASSPLNKDMKYILKIHSFESQVKISQIDFKIDTESLLEHSDVKEILPNDIVQLKLKMGKAYIHPARTQAILIDPFTHNTVAAGMIQ